MVIRFIVVIEPDRHQFPVVRLVGFLHQNIVADDYSKQFSPLTSKNQIGA